jgi:PAS domain S-box-containing protein
MSDPLNPNSRLKHSLHRAMLDQVLDIIVVFSIDGQVWAWNKRVNEITRYTDEELAGLQADRLISPVDSATLEELTEEVITRGETPIGIHLNTRDGDQVFCRVKLSLLSENGRQVICCTGRSAPRQASEEKFRVLAEHSTVGILLIQDGKLQYVNRAFAEMYGYRPEELINEVDYQTLVHPDDRSRVRRFIKEHLNDLEPTTVFHFRGLTKEGRTIHMEANATRTGDFGPPAIIGTIIDITDRRQLQREIVRIQEEERRSIGRDLHDGVGTQLSAISLLLHAISRDITDHHPQHAEKLRQVRRYVREADKNANSVSTGLNPVPLERDGLAAALDHLTSTIEPPERVTCTLGCDKDIPDLPAEVASHLYWIAQEALTNARKYANADELSLQLTCTDTKLTLCVSDDGDGFEHSENHTGGLGLRTMRYRAELLGGQLTIESAPGEGTTITCRLPLD